MEIRTYRAKAAKRPLQFWTQPFLLLLIVGLLWRLLPISALLYKPRVVQPLPDPHVFYVKLDPDYASEVMRAAMQAWRRSEFGAGSEDISLDDVKPFEPLGAPEILEQGARYPGVWSAGDVTPLAQSLPNLLYNSDLKSRYAGALPVAQGIVVQVDDKLVKEGFVFPQKELDKIKGTGSCRFYVECGTDGRVEHVFVMDADVKQSSMIERILYKGSAKGAVRAMVRVIWRNP